jgi:calcium-dependent protein kinase
MSNIQVDSGVAMGALSNLKNFRADQKLKQATFAFIASQLLTKNEKENLAKIFKAIDNNGDGKLSKEEILDGYDKFFGKTMEKEDVLKMFDAVDIDRSGFIDYSEFVVAAMSEK